MNPAPEFPVGILLESFENNISEIFCACGRISAIPKREIIITDTSRKTSADIPKLLTIVARKSVKNVKLSTNPITMPIGLL